MSKKHFMIYYKTGTGTYIITEPMPWSRENIKLFPEFDFISNHPTTNFIEKRLIKEHNFKKVIDKNGVVVVQNLDPNLNM